MAVSHDSRWLAVEDSGWLNRKHERPAVVHVFDLKQVPRKAPKKTAQLEVAQAVSTPGLKTIYDVTFTGDGQLVAVGSSPKGDVQLGWRPGTQPVALLSGDAGKHPAVAGHRSLAQLAAASDRGIVIADMAARKGLRSFKRPPEVKNADRMAWVAGGELLWMNTSYGKAVLLNANTGALASRPGDMTHTDVVARDVPLLARCTKGRGVALVSIAHLVSGGRSVTVSGGPRPQIRRPSATAKPSPKPAPKPSPSAPKRKLSREEVIAQLRKEVTTTLPPGARTARIVATNTARVNKYGGWIYLTGKLDGKFYTVIGLDMSGTIGEVCFKTRVDRRGQKVSSKKRCEKAERTHGMHVFAYRLPGNLSQDQEKTTVYLYGDRQTEMYIMAIEYR